MTAPSTVPLEVIVKSNEKLLKALITLLSLKDEHMLGELKTIFTLASRGGSEIGEADQAVWREISRELDMIDKLVSGEPAADDPPAADAEPLAEGLH